MPNNFQDKRLRDGAFCMFWCANLACLCIHCIDCNEKTIHGTLDLINGTLETTVNGTRS